MKKVIIIGSGFSSLSAACYMQKAGFQVTVLEKNEQIGGRASILQEDGFTFDMGPSWYWMPDVFEKFYQDFGYRTTDFYDLEKLSPGYRVYFGENDFVDISDNLEEIIQKFEDIDAGSGIRLRKFLEKAKKNYKIAIQDLVYQPGQSITELITIDTAKRINLFIKSISDDVARVTSHPHLKSILEFPVLFLGAKPQNTPAFYNFMNWADFGLGTWYPKGGMRQIVSAMEKIARNLGVEFLVNHEVIQFNKKSNQISSVITDKDTFECDIVISGADYAHTETLLNINDKNYSKTYWEKKTFAPSSLLYYIGLDIEIKNIPHHNLFFDTDFNAHAKEIYDTQTFPTEPLFYANFPSQTDESLAPKGKSTAFFLIPTAVDLQDDANIQKKYFEKIIKRLYQNTGIDLKKHIIYQKSFGINDFKTRYHACRGNAYGLANTLLQTSILRPSIKNKKIKNLFYTGQLTVPGPGVPPAIISGKVVSDYILKNNKS